MKIVFAETRTPESDFPISEEGKQQKELLWVTGFPRGEEEYFDSSGPWKKKILVGAAAR
jgi:hypothetical protein